MRKGKGNFWTDKVVVDTFVDREGDHRLGERLRDAS